MNIVPFTGLSFLKRLVLSETVAGMQVPTSTWTCGAIKMQRKFRDKKDGDFERITRNEIENDTMCLAVILLEKNYLAFLN